MRRALDTSTYPEAVFDVTTPTDLAALGVGPLPVEIQVPGSLTIAGVSIPATATLQVQGSAGGLEVAGSVPVVLADLGLDAPDLGFVTVQPSGQVELLLQLTR
jgi:polyisoprenoid-binding protein YceI